MNNLFTTRNNDYLSHFFASSSEFAILTTINGVPKAGAFHEKPITTAVSISGFLPIVNCFQQQSCYPDKIQNV